MKVRVVSATRMTESAFWRQSYLGRSLRAMPDALRPAELAIRFDNTGPDAVGLPAVYNSAIDSASADTALLFVHDDVFIHDPFLAHRLETGFDVAHVLGLAGSSGSDPAQPSWGLAFDCELGFKPLGWQEHEGIVYSGAVSHGLSDDLTRPPPLALGSYGERVAAPADLLDGLFLVVRAGELHRTGVRFDERFDFHLYDIDFCRQARRAGLELMTWPVLVTHASGGAFCTPGWKSAARAYLDKWQHELPIRRSG